MRGGDRVMQRSRCFAVLFGFTVCALGAAGSLGTTGCTVSTSSDGDGGTIISIKPKTKFVGSNPITAQDTWDGAQAIVIENGNGDMIVTAGGGNVVSASAKPFAMADDA